MPQVTHVLDTSALLAHVFQERGSERVRELLRDNGVVLGLSTAVLFELQLRLDQKGVLARHPEVVAEYEEVERILTESAGQNLRKLKQAVDLFQELAASDTLEVFLTLKAYALLN